MLQIYVNSTSCHNLFKVQLDRTRQQDRMVQDFSEEYRVLLQLLFLTCAPLSIQKLPWKSLEICWIVCLKVTCLTCAVRISIPVVRAVADARWAAGHLAPTVDPPHVYVRHKNIQERADMCGYDIHCLKDWYSPVSNHATVQHMLKARNSEVWLSWEHKGSAVLRPFVLVDWYFKSGWPWPAAAAEVAVLEAAGPFS